MIVTTARKTGNDNVGTKMAKARVPEVLLWLEAKRNIGAVQLVLNPNRLIGAQSHKDERVGFEIGVHQQTIICRRVNGEKIDVTSSCSFAPIEINIPLPGDIVITPQSCQGLNLLAGESELHMRLSLKKGAESTDNIWPLDENMVDYELKMLKHSRPSTFCCNSCSNQIVTMPKGFKRVLQLPTEFWQQMSMNLYCHSHDNLPVAMATFGPQKMDCLVGDDILVVQQSVVKTDSVYFTQGKDRQSDVGVKCRRCLKILGNLSASKGGTLTEVDKSSCDKSEGTVTLYKHTLCTDADQPNLNLFRNYTREGYITKRLLAETAGAASFKFLIQGQDSNPTKTYALLWLMPSNNLSIFTNCPPWKSGNIRDLLGRRQTRLCLSSDKDQPSCILKILYRLCLYEKTNNSVFKEWENSSAVKQVKFSEDICLELVLLLRSSTYTLPSSMRTMNGFQVGFLYKT